MARGNLHRKNSDKLGPWVAHISSYNVGINFSKTFAIKNDPILESKWKG